MAQGFRLQARNITRRGHRQRAIGVLVAMTLMLAAFAPFLGPPTAKAVGVIPAGLPSYFSFGLSSNSSSIDWMTQSGSPWDMRYQYLSGGANTGNGWATWNTNGGFAANYMADSAAHG